MTEVVDPAPVPGSGVLADPAGRHRPTLRDVARRSGISVTQVSRALNDHSDVAEQTRARVRQAADELGYSPNIDARRLKAPHATAGSIGLILPSDTLRFSDPFFGRLLTAIVAEAAQHGFELHLSTPVDPASPIEPYEQALRRNRVDGFVLVRTETTDPRVTFLVERGFPLVAFGRPVVDRDVPSVEVEPDSMTPAVRHLVELGHRHLTLLAEPPQYCIGESRVASFARAVGEAGLDPAEVKTVRAGFREASGYRATEQLLTGPEPPTAILAANDLIALGALQAATDLGVKVPEELSIVGFDDIDAARLAQPPLTTFRHDAEDIARLLVRQLLPSIEARAVVPATSHVGAEFVVRASTGPPPGPNTPNGRRRSGVVS